MACDEDQSPARIPALVALLAAGALLALDVRAFREAARVDRALAAAGAGPLPAGLESADAAIAYDFGLGDDRRARIAPPSYRARPAIGEVVLGDPGLAAAALRADVARSAITMSIALGIAAAVLHASRP
jgi:hypothetical protein